MLAVAEQHGVRILEVEYLTAWGTAADRDEAQQKKEQAVFHMARAFGVHHLTAGRAPVRSPPTSTRCPPSGSCRYSCATCGRSR